MFGYVKPYNPELKLREYEAYRGLYCGLCRAMGRATGQGSRLTLNHEFVFLAAVRMLLTEHSPAYKSGRCAVHPIRKRAIAEDSPELTYAAGMSALLAGEKLRDDLADESGLRRLGAALLMPYFVHSAARAARSLGREAEDAAEAIEAALGRLKHLEESGSDSLDDCADAFGEVTRYIFSAGLTGAEARIAREIGGSTGRFIYLADAMDDAAADAKNGRFNPILSLYGESALTESDGKRRLAESTAQSVMTGALCDLSRLGAAIELACDGGDPTLAAIVRNTVYLGMPKVLEDIARRSTEAETNKQSNNGEE